jgi:hypothetical protein
MLNHVDNSNKIIKRDRSVNIKTDNNTSNNNNNRGCRRLSCQMNNLYSDTLSRSEINEILKRQQERQYLRAKHQQQQELIHKQYQNKMNQKRVYQQTFGPKQIKDKQTEETKLVINNEDIQKLNTAIDTNNNLCNFSPASSNSSYSPSTTARTTTRTPSPSPFPTPVKHQVNRINSFILFYFF